MVARKFDKKDLNEIKRICEKAGIKLTAQRLAIYEELLTAGGHPSAEEIYLRLQKKMPTIAVDTVYRTLATFDEIGIASKLHLANKRNLFDVNLVQHHHFVCDSCGGIQDIHWPDFDRSNLPETITDLGEIRKRHLELHGICSTCLKQDKE